MFIFFLFNKNIIGSIKLRKRRGLTSRNKVYRRAIIPLDRCRWLYNKLQYHRVRRLYRTCYYLFNFTDISLFHSPVVPSLAWRTEWPLVKLVVQPVGAVASMWTGTFDSPEDDFPMYFRWPIVHLQPIQFSNMLMVLVSMGLRGKSPLRLNAVERRR